MKNMEWKKTLSDEQKAKLEENEAYLQSLNITREEVAAYQMDADERKVMQWVAEEFRDADGSEPKDAVCIRVDGEYRLYSESGECVSVF